MSGAAAAINKYLATVNSDIELVGNIFKDLVEELERNPKLFAVMPLVFNRNLNKVENLARLYCHRGLCWHTELPEEEQWSATLRNLLSSASDTKSRLRDIAAKEPPIRSVLCGAAFVCRKNEFDALGGFDARFKPFYWEDVDLDYRAREKGKHSAVVPRCAVIHRHSETINRHHRSMKNRYLLLNQLRFVLKHMDALPDLQAPHMWWGARALKELCMGDKVLAKAYFRAGIGLKDV
jgi:GT2 family glycosyltransferase